MKKGIIINYSIRFGPFFVTPIVAGIENGETPLISTYDSIGCLSDNEVNIYYKRKALLKRGNRC